MNMEPIQLCEITRNLFLGTVETRPLLASALGVDVIVDCMRTEDPYTANIAPLIQDKHIYIFCPFKDMNPDWTGEKIPDNMEDLWKIAKFLNLAFLDKKIMIRCHGARNRSPFLMGLVLIDRGYKPEDAVELIIRKRTGFYPDHSTDPPKTVLHNKTFKDYLLSIKTY